MVTGNLESTLVILAVLIMNAVLGTVQHVKAEKSLEGLKAMSAPNARVLRDGKEMSIPLQGSYRWGTLYCWKPETWCLPTGGSLKAPA